MMVLRSLIRVPRQSTGCQALSELLAILTGMDVWGWGMGRGMAQFWCGVVWGLWEPKVPTLS